MSDHALSHSTCNVYSSRFILLRSNIFDAHFGNWKSNWKPNPDLITPIFDIVVDQALGL